MKRTIELWYNRKNGLRGYSSFETIPKAKSKLKELNKKYDNFGGIIDVQYFDAYGDLIEHKSKSYYLDNGNFKTIL